MSFKIAAVQMNSREDKKANLETASTLVREAAALGAEFVALPENFIFLGPQELEIPSAEPIPGASSVQLATLARNHRIYLLAGSMLECVPGEERVYNTSVLFDPDGEVVARYRKLHLFDVDIPGRVHSRESATMLAGDAVVVAETTFGKVGLSICYDLRFPELYRSLALRGARVVICPAAFRLYTGKDHWELLVRARSVENGIYMVAPAQFGESLPDVHCYGNSMIVDPWGSVLARASERECIVVAEIDFDWQDEVRASLPSLAHRRPGVYEL
jgi:predicted amidohydrolase